MTIHPIQFGSLLKEEAASALTGGSSAGDSMFRDMVLDAVNNVKSTQSDYDSQLNAVLSGESDDLHSLMISSTQATLSVQLLAELRNKALDAYNELMRLSV